MRKLLAKHYQDIIFISISGHGKYGRNWSSDTSLNEIMVVAKKAQSEITEQKAWYVALDKQPLTANEAIAIAQTINCQTKEGDIRIGNNRVGWMVKDSLNGGLGNPGGVRSSDLVILGKNLVNSALLLPQCEAVDLPISSLDKIGHTGPYHADINGWHSDETPRGAFEVVPLEDRDKYSSISYPILWGHDTEAEKEMVVTPDTQGRVRPDLRIRPLRPGRVIRGSYRIIGGASKLHINRDFSTTSQSLGACLTPVTTLGGHAWPSLQIKDGLKNRNYWQKWSACGSTLPWE